jgi:hypothetical protein
MSRYKQALRDAKMIRYAILVLAISGSAAAAFTSISPAPVGMVVSHKNISVFYRNSIEAEATPLVLEQCAKEDCSDTPSNT